MSATAFVAPRRWLSEEASRLDASCYATGGIEARERLTQADRPWRALGSVARVFLPPRFARRFVTDVDRGVLFLSSSDILLADLAGLPALSRRATPNLADLKVEQGWSLVTRSGTIGRVAYVRDGMAGLAVSEHAIRVAPSDDLASGFLFAFLASAPAQAMIRQRTYGSVVQHIEPDHLADLPVPTPTDRIHSRVHGLIENAASLRTEAARSLSEAAAYFDGLAGPMPSAHDHARVVGVTRRALLDGRLDAFHHVGWAAEGTSRTGDPIGSLATVSRPSIIRRIWVAGGVPFISGIDAYQVGHPYRQRLRADEAAAAGAVVSHGDILVQRSGQRYGMFGRPAVVSSPMAGWAASEDLIRVRTRDETARARILAYLMSGVGRRRLLKTSYGTSIPHLNPDGVASILVPDLPDQLLASVIRAIDLRERADIDEQLAMNEVEAWLA